jgi:hypothetical protein
MPKNFPGIVEFIDPGDLPPGYFARIQSLWPIGRVIDAAGQIPHAPDAKTVATHFECFDMAEATLLAGVEAIRKVRAWSKSNLEPEQSKTTEPTPIRRSFPKSS